MSEQFTPGCHATGKRFRALVIEAHTGIYFCSTSMGTAEIALAMAIQSINDESFTTWHFHKLSAEGTRGRG